MKKGFDNNKYLKLQTKEIKDRIKKFDNKLYIEFGGKLFDDFHAARVLPGFKPTSKIEVLKKLTKQTEVIICINANDIERHKIRADLGITYDVEVLRLIDRLRDNGLDINSVVITRYNGQKASESFANKLERRNIKTYMHSYTKGYPTDVDTIVSDEGYGANPYIETTKPIVIVTAPGPGGGKLATCLSQMYHEYKRGIKAGYMKYETFPIWNVPLKHPVNIAYEASTADLQDVNMIDPFHLEAYNEVAVNYNRDIEVFPVLKKILEKITGEIIYKSPTDMGINLTGFCITNDDVIKKASRIEILRRYYKSLCDFKQGLCDEDTPKRVHVLMNELNITTDERKVIKASLDKSAKNNCPAFAIELPNGKVITGRDNNLMTAPASCLINAIKTLAGVSDDIYLLSPVILESLQKMNKIIFEREDILLNIQDVLICLSIHSLTNPTIELTLSKLPLLNGSDAHSSHFINIQDEKALRKLKINFTNEDNFNTNHFYND